MRKVVVSIAIGSALLSLASPSSAEPDRTARLSRQSPTATWTSGVGIGSYAGSPLIYERTRCTEPALDCDETLLDLVSGGDLEIELVGGSPAPHPDLYRLELRLYRSNASGEKRSEIPTEDVGTYRERAGSLPAGFYVVEVAWMDGVGEYTGTATLSTRARPRNT